jgi:hypothetical protein
LRTCSAAMPSEMVIRTMAGIRGRQGRLFILKVGGKRCHRVARGKRIPQNYEPGEAPPTARVGSVTEATEWMLGICTAIPMKVTPELRPNLFTEDMCRHASRIAPSGGQVHVKIPFATLGESILNGLRLAGKKPAEFSQETLEIIRDNPGEAGCLL